MRKKARGLSLAPFFSILLLGKRFISFKVVRVMTINHGIQAVSSVYANTPVSSAVRKAPAAKAQAAGDEFVVSNEAKSFSSMLEELRNMDEVREDKVAAVTHQIEAGTYSVSSENVAASLLHARF